MKPDIFINAGGHRMIKHPLFCKNKREAIDYLLLLAQIRFYPNAKGIKVFVNKNLHYVGVIRYREGKKWKPAYAMHNLVYTIYYKSENGAEEHKEFLED